MDKEIELLSEYAKWHTEKRMTANDYSAEAFLIDRAKENALEKLIKIADFFENVLAGVSEDHRSVYLSTHYDIDGEDTVRKIWEVVAKD